MKKLFLTLAAMALIGGGYLFSGPANAAGKTYSGTAYVAGMGGHFAKVQFTVNPADTQNPITVHHLSRIVIGTWRDHAVHDPRIDSNNRNIMMFSTYSLDPKGYYHVGEIDLRTGKVIKDMAIRPDKLATVTGAGYCASGQTGKYYIPVIMTDQGYIDVRSKKTWRLAHRVFLGSIGMKDHNYVFTHGTNTPNMKEFIVVNNMGDATGRKPHCYSNLNGKVTFTLVDMNALVRGKLDVIKKNVLYGAPGDTITFRQSFTPDGKYLLQSAGDRLWVLNAKTLKLYDQKMMGTSENVPPVSCSLEGKPLTNFPLSEIEKLPAVSVNVPSVANGQLHDAISTPDSKYALLTVRVPLRSGKKIVTEGVMQLYDIQHKKMIGHPASVCGACHYKYGKDMIFSAALCGIDVNWKK